MPDIINNNARIGDPVFQNAVDFTLRKEGVLSDDKNDHGGVTKYGITIPFLTDFLGRPATKADILALTAAGAVEIYHEMLWVRAGIGKLPAEIAGAAFDFAVHSGAGRANKVLNNLLKKNVHDMTVHELRRLRNDYVIARGRFLMDEVQHRPSDIKYIEGWFNRVAALLDFAY